MLKRKNLGVIFSMNLSMESLVGKNSIYLGCKYIMLFCVLVVMTTQRALGSLPLGISLHTLGNGRYKILAR